MRALKIVIGVLTILQSLYIVPAIVVALIIFNMVIVPAMNNAPDLLLSVGGDGGDMIHPIQPFVGGIVILVNAALAIAGFLGFVASVLYLVLGIVFIVGKTAQRGLAILLLVLNIFGGNLLMIILLIVYLAKSKNPRPGTSVSPQAYAPHS